MAKKEHGATKCRVLVSGAFGQCNDVVSLAGEELANALESGEVDSSPDAVAFAESQKS